MARKQGISSDDPFYRRGAGGRTTFADDALPLELSPGEGDEDDDRQQFRRASKRVSVRKGPLPRKIASRLRVLLLAALTLATVAGAATVARIYLQRSPRFVVHRAEDIEVAGQAPNSRAQVQKIMSSAVGHNLFAISLGDYRHRLETIPWVESAAVMRLLPNHLRVRIQERTPVAFVDMGGSVELIDASGVLMQMPPGAQQSYSFPVIQGMHKRDPLTVRAAEMRTYLRLMRELDGGSGGAGQQYSRKVDEVDVSDPTDVKVVAQGGLGPVLLHLGKENFLPRFQVFLANVQKWEHDQGKLDAVDLRYGREVILNPDSSRLSPPARPAAAAARPAPAKSTAVRKAVRKAKPDAAVRAGAAPGHAASRAQRARRVAAWRAAHARHAHRARRHAAARRRSWKARHRRVRRHHRETRRR